LDECFLFFTIVRYPQISQSELSYGRTTVLLCRLYMNETNVLFIFDQYSLTLFFMTDWCKGTRNNNNRIEYYDLVNKIKIIDWVSGSSVQEICGWRAIVENVFVESRTHSLGFKLSSTKSQKLSKKVKSQPKKSYYLLTHSQ